MRARAATLDPLGRRFSDEDGAAVAAAEAAAAAAAAAGILVWDATASHPSYALPRQACNAVLASDAGHPLWLWLLRRIERRMRLGDVTDDDDPVGSTGPRMLESALREWEAVHGAGSAARAYVAPADVFYPLWDGGQEATFRERCAPDESAQRGQVSGEVW